MNHFLRAWGRDCFFFFKQKTAYEIGVRLVGSEMCIRDSLYTPPVTPWESEMPEASDPSESRELSKAGLITGVKS